MHEFIAELHNVFIYFKDKHVFSDFSVNIKKGSITGISGNSGRGKTTLLRILAGLQKPDKGQVILHYRKQGYVFQDYRLLPWMSVLENIILPIKNKISQDEAIRRAKHYLDILCLNGCENLRPTELSGGMAQRVSLARAMTYSPDILFLDEPFSALDYEMQEKAAKAVSNYAAMNGTSVVYVSHQLDNLKKMSETIIQL